MFAVHGPLVASLTLATFLAACATPPSGDDYSEVEGHPAFQTRSWCETFDPPTDRLAYGPSSEGFTYLAGGSGLEELYQMFRADQHLPDGFPNFYPLPEFMVRRGTADDSSLLVQAATFLRGNVQCFHELRAPEPAASVFPTQGRDLSHPSLIPVDHEVDAAVDDAVRTCLIEEPETADGMMASIMRVGVTQCRAGQ